jgi:hypothetical protein
MEYPLIIVLAFSMASKEPDFQQFVKERETAFSEWQERNSGDFKAYLDAKILEFSTPKDIKKLKKQVYLLALYKFKKEPPSQALCDSSQKYEDVLRGMDMEKITWQELLDKIKSLEFSIEQEAFSDLQRGNTSGG